MPNTTFGSQNNQNLTTGADALIGEFIGNSRIDGFPIFRIWAIGSGDSVASVIPAAGTADIYATTWVEGTALTAVNVGSLASTRPLWCRSNYRAQVTF